jgi:hypothetical protein
MKVIVTAGVSALVFGWKLLQYVAVIAGARLQDLIIEMRDLQQLRTLHIQGLQRWAGFFTPPLGVFLKI